MRWELDQQKKKLCVLNHVRLIEWPYDLEPTDRNVRNTLEKRTGKEEQERAFLELRDFDEYMEKLDRFTGLRISGALFRKEADLPQSFLQLPFSL